MVQPFRRPRLDPLDKLAEMAKVEFKEDQPDFRRVCNEPIKQVMFPKREQQVEMPCKAMVRIGPFVWKIDRLLSTHATLFFHTVGGEPEEVSYHSRNARFSTPTYVASEITTFSTPMTVDTHMRVWSDLLEACFPPEDVEHKDERLAAYAAVQAADWPTLLTATDPVTKRPTFHVDEWLKSHAILLTTTVPTPMAPPTTPPAQPVDGKDAKADGALAPQRPPVVDSKDDPDSKATSTPTPPPQNTTTTSIVMPAWVDWMMEQTVYQTYVLCLNASKLLEYYPPSEIHALTIKQRAKLLRIVETDLFPLFFYDRIQQEELGELPELSTKRLKDEDWLFLGPQRVQDIWLYQAIKQNEQHSGDEYVTLAVRDAGNTILRMAAARNTKMLKFHDQFDEFLSRAGGGLSGTVRDADGRPYTLPRTVNDEYAPMVRRLVLQGSLVRQECPRGEPRLHVYETLASSLSICRSLWTLRKRKCLPFPIVTPPPSVVPETQEGADGKSKDKSNSNDMVDEDEEDEDANHTMELVADKVAGRMVHVPKAECSTTSSGSSSSSVADHKHETPDATNSTTQTPTHARSVTDQLRASGYTRCDEQQSALDRIEKEQLLVVTGPGGSGKTQLQPDTPGCGEHEWKGPREYAQQHTDEFFGVGQIKVKDAVTGRERSEPKTYWSKAEKLVLAPTGRAARVASSRPSVTGKTAHKVILWARHHPGDSRYHRLRKVFWDELSLWDRVLMERSLRWHLTLPLHPKLVPMGDEGQLRPVGPGQPMHDLLAAGIPHERFTHNHRVTAESRLLADNAAAIARQDLSAIVEQKGVFELVREDDMPIATFIERFRDTPALLQFICHQTKHRDEINLQFMRAYGFLEANASLGSDGRATSLCAGMKLTFLTNLTRPNFVVENGNTEVIARIVDTTLTFQQWTKRRTMGVRAFNTEWNKATTGRARRDPYDHAEIHDTLPPLPDAGGGGGGNGNTRRYTRIVECESGFAFDWTKDLMWHIRPGYCVTVNVMQGSAAKHIVFWEPAVFPPSTNELIETAVGRGIESFTYLLTRLCTAATPRQMFEQAVMRREPRRNTTLTELLGPSLRDQPDWRPTITTRCIQCNQLVDHVLDETSQWKLSCASCIASTDLLMADV